MRCSLLNWMAKSALWADDLGRNVAKGLRNIAIRGNSRLGARFPSFGVLGGVGSTNGWRDDPA